jgi:hypothetical protein
MKVNDSTELSQHLCTVMSIRHVISCLDCSICSTGAGVN